ncbi:MAG: DUF763 domain-containing protein [Thermodesulfovibrionia bacterium]|nr:DUF763 domain-containing protein [Thermodesulfovibrionia bacterium]
MPRTGISTMPLHYGRAPRWLFSRMTLLAREIITALSTEFNPEEVLKRFSDPYWFQAFGCVLGFDWHSSGLTTTVLGATKEGIKGLEKDLNFFIAGGKGTTSRKTPEQIDRIGYRHSIGTKKLIFASRMSAKVDNTAVQDGYQLYHHSFLFTRRGSWAVVQQGMNPCDKTARRYHWLGQDVKDFVVEPHSAVCCNKKKPSLNLVAAESRGARQVSTALAREHPEKILASLRNLTLTKRHNIRLSDINPKKLYSILVKTYERQPADFEKLLGIKGVGPKTIRALSLISELVYGKPPSYRDPARFSFAHGGKDGTPFPVDKKTYDKTVSAMKKAIQSSKIGNQQKLNAIKKLSGYFEF